MKEEKEINGEQSNISTSDLVEIIVTTILIIVIICVFGSLVIEAIKDKKEYKIDLEIALEERIKYPIEFKWDSNLNENLILNEQMFKDIQIKTDEKINTIPGLFQDRVEVHRFVYIDEISKEQFTKFTEDEYINFVINKVKPLDSMSYNYKWLEVRFGDGTKIVYNVNNEIGYYKLETVRNDFQTIGEIYYETNNDNSIYNVRYMPNAIEDESSN